MEGQNQLKLAHSSSGHENHGVHLCHKCGWPFPNPHPSAKHRRAHKKVCGTIEGYKLGVDFEGSSHSHASLDDHLSDEDHKTPSPKGLETSGSEKGIGGAVELPNRSEDEVFSDAVTEFVDAGNEAVARARGGREDAGESAVNVEKVLVKESEAIESVDCGSIAEAVKPPGTTADSVQMQHSEIPESTIISSVSDHQTEFSALPVDSDRNASVDDLIPFKSETQQVESLESEKSKAVDAVFDSSSTLVELGAVVEGKEETVSDGNSLDVKISPDEVAGETAKVIEPLLEKLPEDGSACLKIPETEVAAEGEYICDVSDGINFVNSDYVSEKKGEVDANVHVISVSDHIHEVDNPKIMLEDFKDHEVPNSNQSATSEFELSEDKKDEIKSFAAEENGQSTQSEGPAISAPSSYVLLKDVATEEKADSSRISESQVSDEVGAPREVMAPLMDISCGDLPNTATDGPVQPIHSVGDDHNEKTANSGLSGDYNSEGAIEKPVTLSELAISASENHAKQLPDLREGEDVCSSENVDTEKVGTVEYAGDNSDENQVDNNNGLVKESFVEHAVFATEPAEKSSGLKVDQETDLPDVGKYEKVEIEKDTIGDAFDAAISDVKDETRADNSDGPSVESGSENVIVASEPAIKLTGECDQETGLTERRVEHGTETKEDTLIQTPEFASHLQESQTVMENVECVKTVSDAQLGEEKSNGDSIENQVKERALSPLDAKSSIQGSSTAEDNSAKDSVVSVFGSESFQGESDRQQLGGSVMDLSVNLSSPDSLENNWGSVSVLSLQSDAQAIIDAETASPNEFRAATQEKNNSNQSKPSNEAQHSEKSDMFEPPSFMTLVEPKAENGQNSLSSETHTSQNRQQLNAPSLQAGWFPSITHAAHESQGRKKNEEIIAKVTNWSAGKQQHTPLKSLLGEASQETRAKSPKRKDAPAATTVNSILAPESPLGRPAGKETGKEWDSPARYQTEIKREKRKPKSRPYWAQFMCCSSVH